MILETELTLHCCDCGSEIDDSTAFSFRGALGCEKCVRSYYRDRPAEVDFELQCRRTEAITMLKYERKKLEKLAVKKTAANKRTALATAELQELVLHCFECGSEMTYPPRSHSAGTSLANNASESIIETVPTK